MQKYSKSLYQQKKILSYQYITQKIFKFCTKTNTCQAKKITYFLYICDLKIMKYVIFYKMRSGNLKQQNNKLFSNMPILSTHSSMRPNILVQNSNYLQKQNIENSPNFFGSPNHNYSSPTKMQVVHTNLPEHGLVFIKNVQENHLKEDIPRLGKPFIQEHNTNKLGLFTQPNLKIQNFSSFSTQNSKQTFELWEESDEIVFKNDKIISLQNPQIHNIYFYEENICEIDKQEKLKNCNSNGQINYQKFEENFIQHNKQIYKRKQLQQSKLVKSTHKKQEPITKQVSMLELHLKPQKKIIQQCSYDEDKDTQPNNVKIHFQKDKNNLSSQLNQQEIMDHQRPKIQLKRLLSSAEISQLHKHPEHFLSQSISPIKSFKLSKKFTIDPSPSKIKLQKSRQNVPSFLTQKKKQQSISEEKVSKFLPINSIIKLKVVSETQKQVSFLVIKLLADNDSTTVYLVCETVTNFIYCLKKCQAKSNSLQFDFLVRQGKVGQMLDHSMLLKTYCTLQDDENIYQLIEYMEGMTLFEKNHSQRCNILKKKVCKSGSGLRNSEKVSGESGNNILTSNNLHKAENIKLILSSLLKGTEYLHRHGVIHRDIKPSNIFLTHENNLKIGDFGSCGLIGSKQYVGTLDYVAPEVLLREKYNQGVDLWAIGCIAYQLWVGLPPFYDKCREKTLSNIVDCNYDKQKIDDVSLLCLISSLLQKNSEKRLSCTEALQHPFFDEKQRKKSN